MTTDIHNNDDKATNPVVFFDIALGGKNILMGKISNVFQYSDSPSLTVSSSAL